MGFRSGKRIKQEFLGRRIAQPEADFLAGCDLPIDRAESALRVREAIANLAGVAPGYIHASDSFDSDLVHFDFWGSLDSIAVILELENSLGVAISESQAHEIPDPESIPGFTVADFVRKVVQIVYES